MNNSRIEDLLEQLVVQNEQILQSLTTIASEVSDLKEEFNWVGENSFAKEVVDDLSAIQSTLESLAR